MNSRAELTQLFADAKTLVINYDSDVYKYKSSGLVWMAAFYGVQLLFTADSYKDNWLTRECSRLGANYALLQAGQLDLVEERESLVMSGANSDYRKQLFMHFPSWLEHMCQ